MVGARHHWACIGENERADLLRGRVAAERRLCVGVVTIGDGHTGAQRSLVAEKPIEKMAEFGRAVDVVSLLDARVNVERRRDNENRRLHRRIDATSENELDPRRQIDQLGERAVQEHARLDHNDATIGQHRERRQFAKLIVEIATHRNERQRGRPEPHAVLLELVAKRGERGGIGFGIDQQIYIRTRFQKITSTHCAHDDAVNIGQFG